MVLDLILKQLQFDYKCIFFNCFAFSYFTGNLKFNPNLPHLTPASFKYSTFDVVADQEAAEIVSKLQVS